jgi:hypothetical protein
MILHIFETGNICLLSNCLYHSVAILREDEHILNNKYKSDKWLLRINDKHWVLRISMCGRGVHEYLQLILFIYSLFNEAFSISDYIA